MTIAKDFASKFAVAFVAAAMILSAFAPAVQAAEHDDLQTTINDLLAQVADLQSQLGDDDADTTSASCESIAAPLTVGSMGASVTALQNRLIADGNAIAAGATGYFGAQTKAALAGWQAAHNVAPAVGYYGPITSAAMSASCTPADDSDDDSDDSTDDSDDSTDLQGEADLDKFEIDDADDDTIEENQEDAEIGMFTVEFVDGDAEISRLDISLRGDGEANTNDVAPWDAFDTVSLWVDGEMIAEMDANDENEYLDEDDGSLRFSNLDLVAMEDEEVEITVGATMQNGLDTEELTTWNLRAESLRYFDADGVATTEDNFEGIGSATEKADFDVEMEGEGDDLSVRTATEDPNATTLPLEDDMKTEHVAYAFNLDAGDSDGDVEVTGFDLGVNVLSSTSAAVANTLIVDDIKVMLNGDEVSTEDVIVSDTALGTSNGQINVDFDNGDFMIDAADEVLVEIEVSFKSLPTTREGTTIQFSVNGDDVDAEGADDIVVDGAATGEVHTLRTEGLVLEMTDEAFLLKANSTTDATDDVGEYTLSLK